ncbi:hypothetical protein BSKO_00341 [Bryopsis sp. KO-2023]|nr:hypothetical protein BSKO_00341 [Bryopsis sp. KO-2023]
MFRACATAAGRALRSTNFGAVNGAAKNAPAGQVRGMAGGHGEGVTYAGLTLHKPAKIYTFTAEFMGGLMWFWIFYRFYNDYDTFLFGHAVHFDKEIEEEEKNGGEEAHH